MPEITQSHLEGWREAISDFNDMWEAVFKPAGFSRDIAFLIWQINLLKNSITEDIQILCDKLDE